jgi:hypothetical protein
MAVVQISKIQLRRGKKNQGTGMPQLASGEMAWAIDTQELYIGNGAISEGAPAVGNTKVLTEKDNIISIAGQYQYKYDRALGDSSLAGTVRRTIQDRLDEGTVNAKSFGILPFPYPLGSNETTATQAAKMQAAFNEVAGKTKVTIEFDAGEYRFSNTLTLPSNVRIKGQGKDHTVLRFTTAGDALVAEPNAERISIKDMTLRITNNNATILTLNNNKNCLFDSVKFLFDDGGSAVAGSLSNNRIGIKLTGTAIVSNNQFSNIEFSRLTYGIYGNGGSSFNTFTYCLFDNLYKGAVFGDSTVSSSNYNIISHGLFDNITNEAIEIIRGFGNKSISNKFKNVASSLSGTFSTASVIKFHTDKNSSVDDFFERQQFLQEYNSPFGNNTYLPEVDGVSFYSKNDPTKVILDYNSPSNFPETAITIPLKNTNGIKLDYVVNSLAYDMSRRGTMYIIINKTNNTVEITDEYEVRGETEDSITFNGSVETQGGVKVLKIKYVNSSSYINDNNELSYTYSVLS